MSIYLATISYRIFYEITTTVRIFYQKTWKSYKIGCILLSKTTIIFLKNISQP